MVELTVGQVILSLGLVVATLALATWQRLRLTGLLAIATLRTVVQLAAVGYGLAIVFAWRNPWVVVAVLGGMMTIAAFVARNRIGKDKGSLPWVGAGLVVSTAITLAYTLLVVVQPDPWYDPRYVIPLGGMVMGNGMNAAAIAGDRLVSTLKQQRLAIETHLSLGATPAQATAQYRREAIKAGLIPTLNAMMVVGIVTLPGIITGQLLGGADPLNAALYQMVIMFMLAFSTLVTAWVVTTGLLRQSFNDAAQLLEIP